MKKKLLLVAILVAAVLSFAYIQLLTPQGRMRVKFDAATQECFEGGQSSPKWRYCINTAKGGTNGGLVYHFHGRSQDETIWNDDDYFTGQIQRYWQDHSSKPPIVVSISFGPTWVLAPKNEAKYSGLLELFINEVMPTVEQKTGKPEYRGIIGESMGGLNALILALSTDNLFKKVVALCPPVYSMSPFSSWKEMFAFTRSSGADPKSILAVLRVAKDYIRTDADWKKISPMDLLDSLKTLKTPQMYVSAGLYDKYGNYDGVEAFAKKAQRKGIDLQWRPVYGGHCAVDITSAAANLLK